MPNVTIEQLEELQSGAARARGALRSMKAKAIKYVGTAVHAAETVGTASAMGYVRGRYGEVTLAKVPVELIVGVAGVAGALVSPERYSDDMMAVGVGSLSAYATAFFAKMGDEHRKKAGGGTATPTPQVTSGYAYPALSSGYAYPMAAYSAYQQQPQY